MATTEIGLVELRDRLSVQFMGGLGASSVVLYALAGRRLRVLFASHRDSDRAEQFEAIAALTRGVALSTGDFRASAGRSGRTHRDRYTAPVRTHLGRPDSALFDQFEHRIAVPVEVSGQVVGVIAVAGDAAVIDVIESTYSTQSHLSEWATSLPRRRADFGPTWNNEAMSELASALTAAVSRDDMAAEVLDIGLDAVGAPAGSFMMMARPGVYELVQSRNIDRRLVDRWGEFTEVPGRDPFSDAIDEQRALFFPTVEALIDRYPHLWEDVAGTGHSSWAVIPFSSRPAGPIGAIGLIFETAQPFDRPQRIAMRSVSHLAATAALRIESQSANEATLASMTDQLLGMNDIATDIDHVNTSGYYRPAGEHSIAGGDWFDVIDDPTDSGRTYVVLGDVADHGPGAVGTMVAVRAWIQSAVHDGNEPAEIADKVSRLIYSYRYPITTAVIARLDPADRTVVWSCAGHPLPLFADDDDVTLVGSADGPPLGAWREPAYTQTTTTIEKPVSIVLYSDGLLQRYASDLEAGFEALRSTARLLNNHQFSAHDLVKRLSTPEAFSDDDVAVLVIHFTSNPASTA